MSAAKPNVDQMPPGDRPLRVTMINKYYPPHLGGVEFVMRDMAEGMAHRGMAEMSAIVSNGENERVEEDVNGVRVLRLPRLLEGASMPIATGFSAAIRAEAKRNPPADVFHLHFPYPWGEVSWLLANTDVPTVVTYHSDIVRQKTALVAYRPLLERFLDRVDLIMASSPNLIEHSEFLRPRAEKCRHIDFGVPVERIAENDRAKARAVELRAQYPDRKLVLFVGRLVYYKGADVLVRAMESVDAELIMIGKGPLEGELREMAVARAMSNRVHFLTPQDDDELHAWYHAADVFALPSVARSEAFGLVQIESHAAGTPVVSTDLTTGVPYANLDGVTGLTVPVGDHSALAGALNRLLADDALRSRLGKQARERALRDFTIDRMCDNVMGVYREAIALHASRRRA